jgi:hypothetical protein
MAEGKSPALFNLAHSMLNAADPSTPTSPTSQYSKKDSNTTASKRPQMKHKTPQQRAPKKAKTKKPSEKKDIETFRLNEE